MSCQTTRSVEVRTTVSLRVPRGEAGDLQDGVRDVLANADPVDAVHAIDVGSMEPTWTDLRVTATADVAIAPDGAASGGAGESALEATLADGFGVEEVTSLERR